MCLLKGAAPVTAFLPLFWECTCYSASGFYWGTLHKYPILHKQGVCHPQPSTHPERDRQTEPEQESETDEICVSVCVCSSIAHSVIDRVFVVSALTVYFSCAAWLDTQTKRLIKSVSVTGSYLQALRGPGADPSGAFNDMCCVQLHFWQILNLTIHSLCKCKCELNRLLYTPSWVENLNWNQRKWNLF